MTRTALSPSVQVQVWSIQAVLIDDKPRTFQEIEQFVGFDPEDALRYMFHSGSVSLTKVEGVSFFTRLTRRK